MKIKSYFILGTALVSLSLYSARSISAEVFSTNTTVKCGTVAEFEFSKSMEVHTFLIDMEPGDYLHIVAIPIGKYLRLGANLFEPTGTEIYYLNGEPGLKLDFKPDQLSGRGKYKILMKNFLHHRNKNRNYPGTAGLYELYVNCKKRNKKTSS